MAKEAFRIRWTWAEAEGVTFQKDVSCCEECARSFAARVAMQEGRALLDGGPARVGVKS